jgi:phosphate acetyltransferase
MKKGLKRPLELAISRASSKPSTISLSEGHEPRIVEAAVEAVNRGIAKIILVGKVEKVKHQLAKYPCSYPDRIEIHDPIRSSLIKEFSKCYYELRKHKGITYEDAKKQSTSNLVYAALLVKNGHADGTLSGAVETTSNVVKTAIWVLGKATQVKTVSSCFLIFPKSHEPMIYADCGLVIEPNDEELVDITIAASQSCKSLLNTDPRIALLSFSTKGSAKHRNTDKILSALKKLKSLEPELLVDGELQFDAALDSAVGKIKAPESKVAGTANVMIFPNLDAGNIAYKITQRLGNADAYGPILQGLEKPANDLSRGASPHDITQMIAVTVLQAIARVQ